MRQKRTGGGTGGRRRGLPLAVFFAALVSVALLAGSSASAMVGSVGNAAVGAGPHAVRYDLAGCFADSLAANDDGSTGPVSLPFTGDFFGNSFSSLYVNNNGNVTFNGALSTFTPFGLLSTSTPIIAPFFADVDTRATGSDLVTYGATTLGGHEAFCANWAAVNANGVGYYSGRIDKQNSFQLVLIDRSDLSPGDFDIEMNYDQVQWETGDASGGSNGLGGSPARVGYSNGTTTAFELSGSGVPGALLDSNPTGLINGSRETDHAGRYVYEVRNGQVQNSAPVANDDSYSVDSGSSLDVTAPGLLANDTDANGDILSAAKVSNPGHGDVTVNSNGSFTYTPSSGFAGQDSFTYKANDGSLDSNVATVSLTVNQTNHAPSCSDVSATTNQDAAVDVTPDCSDLDGDALAPAIVAQPSHGSASIVAGKLHYIPAAGYFGSDSFTYRANDGTVNSSIATASITVQQVAPAPPTNLSASAVSTAAINLAWSASALASSYQVLRSTTSGGPYSPVASPVLTNYQDSGLASGTTYYYVVKAINSGGSSNASGEASATTAPAAPTGLVATAASASAIDLSWTAPTGAARYQLLRSTVSGGPYSPIASPTATSYHDSGLASGTTYYYVVRAVNSGGNSAVSSQASAMTAPAAPTNLVATATPTGRINLSWGAPTGATSYQLLRSTTSGGPYSPVASPAVTSYQDSGVASGTTYYYVVRAVNSGGSSVPSNQASAKTVPEPPSNVAAVTASASAINLSWTASTGADSYQLLRSTTSGGPYTPIGFSFLLTYGDSGLTSGTAYYYVLRALNSGGNSPLSSQVSATTLPVAPANLVAKTASVSAIDLSWSGSSGATRYQVLRSATSGGPYSLVASPTTTSYHDTGLASGTAYYYLVKAANSGGSSDPSNQSSATTAPGTETISVSRIGTGTGGITSSPAGIDCGASCSASFASGEPVTLTAIPAANSTFAGWSGACSGTAPTCVTTASGAKSTTATFSKKQWSLKVAKSGAGSGGVKSAPAGIDCGASCEGLYDDGTTVTLTATAAAGSSFDQWSGACSGSSPTCTVTLQGASSATAEFQKNKTPPPGKPVAGKDIDVGVVSGTVKYKKPGSNEFVELTGTERVPEGTIIDATNGVAKVTSSQPNGTVESANFWSGMFRIDQYAYQPAAHFNFAVDKKKPRKPKAKKKELVTQVSLVGGDFTSCKNAKKAEAGAGNASPPRKLWGKGKGKFRTKGRYSSATVRGTTWYVEDQCGGTLTKVKTGIVEVRDFVKALTVFVRAGDSYFAAAKPPKKR